MTIKQDNRVIKQYLSDYENYHDLNEEIKDIISKNKFYGLSKSSTKGLNNLYVFLVLKNSDYLTNKDVMKIIEDCKSQTSFENLKVDSEVKQYISDNFNYEMIQSFDSTLEPNSKRTCEQYGNAIRKTAKDIQEHLNKSVPVPVKSLTNRQKAALDNWLSTGLSVEELIDYVTKK